MQRVEKFWPLYGYGLIALVGMALLLSSCQKPNLSLKRTSPAKLLVAPLRQPIEPVPASGFIKVRENDNLFRIASRFQVTPQAIIETNQLEPPFILIPHQSLKIIPPRTHIVRHGDSVYTISQRYAVSQYQLAQLNNLLPPFELEIGQRLQLPNSLDFSVLDVGVPNSITGKTLMQKDPATNFTSNSVRKKYVAPLLGVSGGFTWPVKGEVISEFGPSQRGVHNDGVNIAATEGHLVGAAADGRVAFVGTNIKSFGKLVLVKHDGGIITAYAHLGDITVQEGELVEAGQTIGTIGSTGRVATPQLHFEIRKSRKPIDPRSLIS